MPDIIQFDAPMVALDGLPNNGAVLFPFDLQATFGKKSVKVKITYDGIEYRGLLKRMGSDDIYCLIRKDIRERLGKKPGDLIHVTVEEDTEERVVQVPEDFQLLLDGHSEAKTVFEKLSFTCKKEYVQWIEEAKKSDTRQNRMMKSLGLLAAGKKEPK